jgi:hypothetical protein
VQVTLLGGAPRLQARRGLRTALAGRDGLEDGIHPPHRLVLAADHQAVTPVQAPHAAVRPDVDEVDAVPLEIGRPGDVVR